MFIWTIPAILAALGRHTPELGGFVSQLHRGTDFSGTLASVFPGLPKISIDYAIMEKAARVLMVESAFDWDDVGSWTAIAKYLGDAGESNASNTTVATLDAAHNIVFSEDKLCVALLGVSDVIVVQTKDAILICNRHEAERIKHLVAKIPPAIQ
jgi:mannose-1-phosphate guanylyltransferase